MNDRLRQCRIDAGYSQKYVALCVGVSMPTVSMWESGAKSPSIDNLMKLADLFNTSIDYLVGRIDKAGRSSRHNPPLSQDARRLLSDYASLSAQGKEYIRQQMEIAKKIYGQSDAVSVLAE